MRPRLFLVCAMTLVFLACTSATPPAKSSMATTVIAVRHAETEEGGSDPGLSEAGSARARALAAAAAEAGISAVYVTQLRRTRETAEPLASMLGIPITVVTVDRARIVEHPAELWRRIVAEHPGETVLVVGHSNTIPALVEVATGEPVPEIAHDEFDRLYILTSAAGEKGRVIAARYGRE